MSWLYVLFNLVTLPAAILMLAALAASRSVFDTRFIVGSVPGYWLMMAVLCDLSGRSGRLFRISLLTIALLAVVLPLRNDLTTSPIREAVEAVATNAKEGDSVLADVRVGSLAYWELRRSQVHLPFALVPARAIWGLSAPPQESDRIWVFCKANCDQHIARTLRGYSSLNRYGTYLTLYGADKEPMRSQNAR